MNWDVFITCAITGAGDTTGKSAKVPVTPKQIAESAIEAAKAGAAIVHIHVRDPETGKGARDPKLYAEVVDRVRSSGTDVVLNLTAGMGGDLVFGGAEKPFPVDAKGTDMAGATERLAHVEQCLPEICTLDCGSMNFAAGGDYVMVNTPDTLRAHGKAGEGARRPARARGLRYRPPRAGQGSRPRGADRRSADDPALHGHSLWRAGRSLDLHGDGPRAAAGHDLLGLLDQPDAASLCRHGGDRRRQCPGRARGQHLSLAKARSRRTASSSSARSRFSRR